MPGEPNDKSIRLQGVGWVYAIPAEELEVGDRVMFNYGAVYRIESVVKQTAKTVTFEMVNEKTGKVYETRKYKTKLMARLRRNKSEPN